MFNEVKVGLGISTDKLDLVIENHIKAAKLDLARVGVKKIRDDDPLIIVAITDYARAKIRESDRHWRSYVSQRCSLALSKDYSGDV